MEKITLIDLAKKLNVSMSTVSRALRDHPDISPETKEKIKKLAEEEGYFPNHIARSLTKKSTGLIGVVIPDVANSFFSFVVHGIMDGALKQGYHIILTISREDPKIERENLMTLLSLQVDGLLVAISKDTADSSSFDIVKKRNVPLVFFDRALDDENFSSICIDDRKGAQRLIEYVVGCGYTKIAHLAGSSAISIGRNRRQGYLDVLEKYNLPVKEEWILEGGFDKNSGYEGFMELCNRSDELPEVVFAANDRIAQGAYEAAKEKGLNIPNDVGFVAFGHSEFAKLLSPSLTIIDSRPTAIGKRAMDLLSQYISPEHPVEPQRIVMTNKLEINDSLIDKKSGT